MEIRRGKPPEVVERELVVDISREEVLTILTNYIKRKLNTDRIRIEDLDVVVSKDSFKLDSMTLRGAEVIPLSWGATEPSDKATTPPIIAPPLAALQPAAKPIPTK